MQRYPRVDDALDADTAYYDPLAGTDDVYADPEYEGMWGEDDHTGAVVTGSTRASSSRHNSASVAAGYTTTTADGAVKPVGRGPPTKLELRLMAEARERQRSGIVHEQVR